MRGRRWWTLERFPVAARLPVLFLMLLGLAFLGQVSYWDGIGLAGVVVGLYALCLTASAIIRRFLPRVHAFGTRRLGFDSSHGDDG